MNTSSRSLKTSVQVQLYFGYYYYFIIGPVRRFTVPAVLRLRANGAKRVLFRTASVSLSTRTFVRPSV